MITGFNSDINLDFAKFIQGREGLHTISSLWKEFSSDPMTPEVKQILDDYGHERYRSSTFFVAVCSYSGARKNMKIKFWDSAPKLWPEGKTLFGIDLTVDEQTKFEEVWNLQKTSIHTRWGEISIGIASRLNTSGIIGRNVASFPISLNGILRLTATASVSGMTNGLIWSLDGSPVESVGGSGTFTELLESFLNTYEVK